MDLVPNYITDSKPQRSRQFPFRKIEMLLAATQFCCWVFFTFCMLFFIYVVWKMFFTFSTTSLHYCAVDLALTEACWRQKKSSKHCFFFMYHVSILFLYTPSSHPSYPLSYLGYSLFLVLHVEHFKLSPMATRMCRNRSLSRGPVAMATQRCTKLRAGVTVIHLITGTHIGRK